MNIYNGPDATGEIIASFPLPATPVGGAGDPSGYYTDWVPVGVLFEGTAYSIDFVGAPNYIGFDNITFGDDDPIVEDPVPEPAAFFGGLALAGLALTRALRRK